jgi:pimeloyl-ACP methyl ester carboxylesterase
MHHVKLLGSCRLLAALLCWSFVLSFGAYANEPGTLVEVTPAGTVQASSIGSGAQYAVETYLLRYATEALDGSSTLITAQLFVPQVGEAAELSVYAFAPGSTGLLDRCAPSTEHVRGINWGQYRAHVLQHTARGMIGFMPDYMGFGDPEMLQPYFVAEAEARVLLDGLRAVQVFFAEREDELQPGGAFLAGYSQGGHAVFAAADRWQAYAPEVELLGVIGYGPTTELRALFVEFTVVAPLVIYTYAQLYGDAIQPHELLAERWAASLEQDVTSQCIGAIQSFYPYNPRQLFRSEFADALFDNRLAEAFPSVHEVFEANNSGLAGHSLPALILQGTEDTVVSVASQDLFVRRLCEAGSAVRYPHYIGARHDTRGIGFDDAQAWMRTIVAGEAPPSDCEALEGG